jgi:hypothetical protein
LLLKSVSNFWYLELITKTQLKLVEPDRIATQQQYMLSTGRVKGARSSYAASGKVTGLMPDQGIVFFSIDVILPVAL